MTARPSTAPPSKAPLPPLIKTITVGWNPEAAFRRFTREMGTWWPLTSHSCGGRDAENVVFEEKVGGRIIERIRGGREATWGTVTQWDPPRVVAFTWHPARDPDTAQNVEVRFHADGAGTRLELIHTNWETFGAMAKKARGGYNMGWDYVLAIWAGRRNSLMVRSMDVMIFLMKPFQKRMARKFEAAARG
jgi:hypothetical protein